jgi:hypothetical protein
MIDLLPLFRLLAQDVDNADAERLGRMSMARKARDGHGPRPPTVKPGQGDDTTRVNFLRMAVNKSDAAEAAREVTLGPSAPPGPATATVDVFRGTRLEAAMADSNGTEIPARPRSSRRP